MRGLTSVVLSGETLKEAGRFHSVRLGFERVSSLMNVVYTQARSSHWTLLYVKNNRSSHYTLSQKICQGTNVNVTRLFMTNKKNTTVSTSILI